MTEALPASSFTIRLRVHETNRPLSGILVRWYVTSDRVVREEISDPVKWDARCRGDLDELGLRGIGSTITDDSGAARLFLRTDLEAAGAGRRAPNLWYTVRTPDIAGARCCGRTIHVACELIPLGPGHEEILVRIPASSLGSAATARRASAVVDANIQAADLADALRALEGAPAPPARMRASIGQALNKEIAGRVEGAAEARGLLNRRRSAANGLDIRSRHHNDAPSFAAHPQTGKLVVMDPQTGDAVPVVFDGIERYANARLTEGRIERPHVVVDEARGGVKLVLPRVPDVLVARDAPSRLTRYLRS